MEKIMNVENLLIRASNVCNIEIEKLKSNKRYPELVKARRAVWAILYRSGYSKIRIAREFEVSRANVIFGLRKVDEVLVNKILEEEIG
jgi:chromosomal replication initiation ATPase DnaA